MMKQAADDTSTPVIVKPESEPTVITPQQLATVEAKVEAIAANGTNGHVEPLCSHGGNGIHLSDYGLSYADELIKLFTVRAPALSLGETGDGKSVIMRHVCAEVVKRGLLPEYKHIAFNFSVGTNVDILIGQTVLVNNDNGTGQKVVFIPGMLTLAIEYGHAFLGEEMTRANQELLSRFYGILDTRKQDRYWAVPEGIIRYLDGQVPVHPNHWFVGTANPEGGGYLTQRFDPAFRSRWFAIMRVKGLLADERKIAEDKFPNDARMVGRIMRFVETVRGNEKTRMSTREVYQLCELISIGFDPVRAVEVSIAEKFRELGEGVVVAARAHF
ncbi:MAG: AAA family ATPase [bacterium]|nr:AAA family ATPase [bacterium]